MRCSNTDAQLLRGVPVAHRDFDDAVAADQAHQRAAAHVGIRAQQRSLVASDPAAPAAGCDPGGWDVADQIPEAVDADDLAAEAASGVTARLGHGEAHGIADRPAELLRRDAIREVGRHWGEDVSAMKCPADLWQPEARLIELPGLRARFSQRGAEDAVVRADVGGAFGGDEQGTPRAPHAGIDHGQVDRRFREVGCGTGKHICGLTHVLGRDLVGQIHEADVRRDAEDHAFHDADKAVGQAEVCGQRYDGHLEHILHHN